MKRDGDTVTITLTAEQYDQLLIALGLATGSLGPRPPAFMLRLVNAVCEGSPSFRPYQVDAEAGE